MFLKSPDQMSIQSQYKLLDAVVAATSDGVWVCDGEARVILLNPAAERINSIKKEDVIGKTMYELVEEGFVDKSAVIEVIKSGEPVSLLQYREGRKLTSTGTPVFDENGKLMTVVVSTQDVTEIDRLRNALDRQEILNDNYRSQLFELQEQSFSGFDIIAKSPNIQNVIRQIQKASGFDSTVMFYGESGTGKGLFAKLMHKQSKRADNPFISINCGAIPETLIESELFGYEKGAFTGANSSKPGLIEVADGGILFLDEIAELTLQAQVKLLKFIEDGMVTRLGGTSAKQVDIQIIAATHRDLIEMTEQKRFREDLFYRLNVIHITIPPLRERKECLVALIRHYMKKISRQNQVNRKIANETLEYLLAYSYPGNIRQLINICERLVVLTDKETIEPTDLPKEVLGISTPPKGVGIHPEQITLKEAVGAMEKQMLQHAYQECRTQVKVAERLGISQASVARKMKQFNLDKFTK